MGLTEFLLLAFIGIVCGKGIFTDCSVQICSMPKVEMDYFGRFWPKYCYRCAEGESEVIFLRQYLRRGWEYVIRGSGSFEGRVLLKIYPCNENEIDEFGNIWTRWCFEDKIIEFERESGDYCAYIQDYQGGYNDLQYRRIVNQESFIQLETDAESIENINGENQGEKQQFMQLNSNYMKDQEFSVENFIRREELNVKFEGNEVKETAKEEERELIDNDARNFIENQEEIGLLEAVENSRSAVENEISVQTE